MICYRNLCLSLSLSLSPSRSIPKNKSSATSPAPKQRNMNLSEEWKSMWPISSVFSSPLLLLSAAVHGGATSSSSKSQLGPLFFNPSPQTLTLLFSSPSLSPLLPPPFPSLSLPRFLSTTPSSSHPFSLLPSTASSLSSSSLLPLPHPPPLFLHNRLISLRLPSSSSLLVFFPTGHNFDQVGFLMLSVKNSNLILKTHDFGGIFTAKNKLNHQILRLLVSPAANSSRSGSGNNNSSVSVTTTISIGYLLACTMYGVHWFSVRIRGRLGSEDFERPCLDFMGSKLFKSCCVVHASWSHHLPEECVVLLESGELFLFDLDSCSKNARFSGNKLRVSWKIFTGLGKGGWLSCEFSWHPRILIVAHYSAVFLVDLRAEGCNVSVLLKIDTLAMCNSVQNDRFVVLSKAGSNGFCFVLASDHWLLLCDVRKPFMPLLQWAHDLANPSYINVFPLSELRSHSKDDNLKWASESGFCIIMGSFWNCDFSLFCYGPPPKGTIVSEMSRFYKSFYAWDLPSELSLSGRECHCGSCLVREEFSKDVLPEWIDWRQKKDIVLGFGILDRDLHAELSEQDGFGGFTLIRLMSSGKLESQRYCASWEFMKVLTKVHKEPSLHFEDTLLYAMGEGDYKFPKRFKYLNLDYLNGYMKDNLAELLRKRMKNPCKDPCEKSSFSVADFHQCICEKLKACGFNRLRSSPTVSDVFEDIQLLTSIHEVALRRIWTSLPADLLQLAFSCYSEFLEVLVDHKKVSLEFLDVPSRPQLPPFVFRTPSFRSGKWSQKVPPSTGFVGPVLPTPVLLTLRKLHAEAETDLLSVNDELSDQCNEVIQVASEMALSGSGLDAHNDHAVSLADSKDEIFSDTQKVNLFTLHKPAAISSKFSAMDPIPENSVCNNERFTTFISKTPEKGVVPNSQMEMVGPELFNSLSPLEFKFDDHTINFGPKELKTFKLLMRQYSNFLTKL